MLLKLLKKSIHPTNPSKYFHPLLYLPNNYNLTLQLHYTYKTQTPPEPESSKQQPKHLTSYQIYKNKKKQYLDEQKQKRKYKSNLAWQQLIQKCDNNTKNLIRQVLENKRYNKKLLDQLTIVLDYQRHVKLINQYGIGLLVIALNMSNNSQFQNYKQRAVTMFLYVFNNPKNNNIDPSLIKNNNKFLSPKNKTSNNTPTIQTIEDLANTKDLNQNVQQIVVLLSQYTFELIKKSSDRSKKPKTKSQYLKFLKKYTKYVNKIQSLYRMIHILCQIQQNNYFMDRFRFSTIAQQLDIKLQKQIIKNQEYLHYKNYSISKSEYFNIYPHTLYVKIFHMLDSYYFQKFGSLQFYLGIVCAEGFYPRELDHTAKIKNIMSMYRYVYGYNCPKLNKNPFLPQLQQNYYSNPQFAKCLQNYQDIYCIVTFVYMMQSKFYNQYIKLPSILVDDHHLAITQLPTIPELSKFQQQFYKLKQKSILQNSPLKQILYKLYPQITNKQLIQSIIKQKNKPFERISLATDNQFSLRISQALKNLKIGYQKQIFINNKRVDFLLKNTNIIIQCDGDIHIDFSNNNISVETGWRNMLFLLTGYRIIVIDIYELNKSRTINQLEQLIVKKLQIMNDHNAYLVQ